MSKKRSSRHRKPVQSWQPAPQVGAGQPALQLHVANRALAGWWALAGVGLFTLVFPGYWVAWFIGAGATSEVFAMIRAAGGAFFLLGVGRALYARYAALYTVTPDAVSARLGVFAHNTNYVRKHHIRTIEVRQSTLGRLLGFGDIAFASAGTSYAEVVFARVRGPVALKQRITDTIYSVGLRVSCIVRTPKLLSSIYGHC